MAAIYTKVQFGGNEYLAELICSDGEPVGVQAILERSTVCGEHGTLTFVDGKCYGYFTTRRTPETLVAGLALGSQERCAVVARWYQVREMIAAEIAAIV